LQLGLEDFVEFQLGSLPPLPQDFHTIKRSNVGLEPALQREPKSHIFRS
jgi:hypothetical protein